MTDISRILLKAMQADKKHRCCFRDEFGSMIVGTGKSCFGDDDIVEGVQFRKAMDELVQEELAEWISQECIQLIPDGERSVLGNVDI